MKKVISEFVELVSRKEVLKLSGPSLCYFVYQPKLPAGTKEFVKKFK